MLEYDFPNAVQRVFIPDKGLILLVEIVNPSIIESSSLGHAGAVVRFAVLRHPQEYSSNPQALGEFLEDSNADSRRWDYVGNIDQKDSVKRSFEFEKILWVLEKKEISESLRGLELTLRKGSIVTLFELDRPDLE